MSDVESEDRADAGVTRVQATLRILLALALVVLLSIAVVRFPLLRWLVDGAERARGAGLVGALAGAGAIIAATLLLAPVVPLIMLCGWVWGFSGIFIALPAAALSAMIAFSIARALGRTSIANALKSSPRAAEVIKLAERGGPLTVAMLRLTPIIPFTPGNVALGLTALTLRDISLGTMLGLLPGSILYVTTGALLPDASSIVHGNALRDLFSRGWLLFGVALALLALAGATAWFARRLHARSKRSP